LVRSFTVLKGDSIGFVVRKMDPVLGGEVVERQQLVGVVGDLLDGLGALRAAGRREVPHRRLRVAAVLGVADLLQDRSPVASSTRLSFTRGAAASTAPAVVVTWRGRWRPLRTTSLRPCSSFSPASSAMY
jgi:hypothetical protein